MPQLQVKGVFNMGKIGTKKVILFTAVFFAIILIIIICIIAVKFKSMELNALPSNFIGAIIGALIGAVITVVLLYGQTSFEADIEENRRKLEEDKIKNIRILEMKTPIFKGFINSVWEVWKAQIITIEKFDQLTTQYYQNLMIYLKDESKLEVIGNALTAMGEKIDKTTYNEILELRKNIVTIIDTLSEDIGLGGKIDMDIMDKHDKIVFPTRLKKKLLNKLNEALNVNGNSSPFKEGKYESIWEGRRCIFITFELKGCEGIKLAIGEIGAPGGPGGRLDFLDLVFMVDPSIQDQEIKKLRDNAKYNRLDNKRLDNNVKRTKVLRLSDPIPDDNYVKKYLITDEDNKPIPYLDFLNEESMKNFREKDYPDILSKRVLYHLYEWWKIGELAELGYIEFFKKHIKQEIQ
jgi:hypothetical protein